MTAGSRIQDVQSGRSFHDVISSIQVASAAVKTEISSIKLLKAPPAQLDDDPPRFTLPLCNQTGKDGRAITLIVNYIGSSPVLITWFNNGHSISANSDFLIVNEVLAGDIDSVGGQLKESRLTIKELFPDDEGEYTCKAENSFGAAVTHCHLGVQCKQIAEYNLLLSINYFFKF